MNIIEFDIRGQMCPATLLIALKEINNHGLSLEKETAKLIFLTDNRDCLTTLPESVTNMGYSVNVTKNENCYSITISGGQQ
ncbi:MAG: sulfurtransferase TusA family protein [Nitrospirae bacterium]|nr:sulfurtransferase TusA family protein [Nitrospirota bacterium]